MRRSIPILGALMLGAATLVAPAGVPAADAAADIVELPVSFKVKNTNQTTVPCLSDGLDYTVKGHIVAPAAMLDSPKAATLYLHAVTWGEYYWRFKAVPGYDYASQMAEAGHVSVTIDRLGYGASPKPEGQNGTCFGSEADVAHQIVGALRSGEYELDGHAPVAFPKVFTAGSSVGALIANIEAYNFDDVDGIINFGWGDFAVSEYAFSEFNDLMKRCAQGGDEGTPGYAAYAKDTQERFYFHSAEQKVRDAVPVSNVDPCGQARSIPPGIGSDMANLGRIDVPVYLIFGDQDDIFPPPAAQQQAARYSGSPEVFVDIVPDASHYPLVERDHNDVVAGVAAWLDRYSG